MKEAATRSILDDITETLSIEAENAGFAVVPPDVLRAFHTDSPRCDETGTLERNERVERQRPVVDSFDARIDLQAQPAPEFAPQVVSPEQIALMDMNSLFEAVRSCAGCQLSANRSKVVFGAGSVDADLMFIGEGPGREEDRQGVPFVGEAGQLLTKMINAMRFSRSEVYIANIVKCHPPGNRNPEDEEAAACLPFLRRQIELVEPKAIVLLGAVALKYLMGVTGITRARGNWLDYNGIKVMPTFHPAYLLRNPHSKKEVWQDLQKVMAFLGKPRTPISGR